MNLPDETIAQLTSRLDAAISEIDAEFGVTLDGTIWLGPDPVWDREDPELENEGPEDYEETESGDDPDFAY